MEKNLSFYKDSFLTVQDYVSVKITGIAENLRCLY